MAKKTVKIKHKIEHRDWVTILLAVAVVATNWIWYQYAKSQDITNRNDSSAWLMHQAEINKLKACIDEGAKPCDISSGNKY